VLTEVHLKKSFGQHSHANKTKRLHSILGGSRGRDHMVVGLTTTYAISAYQH